MKEENIVLENPLGISSESEDFLTPDKAEEILNETYPITDKLTAEPNLLVARAGLNEHGLWGYICKVENGKWKSFGYTLEPTKNVPEKGYIPHGVYKFKRWDSTKLKKTLRLYSVANFTNVLVHVGNTKSDTRGCILAAKTVDNIKKPTRLVSSRVITDYLYDNFSQGHIVVGWL
jgi:hypothetical protein